MGAFALCVESATRDIHSLLALHRVHPQVRTDIQRILGSLLRKSYENMTVSLSKDLVESPEQVCRALMDNIVEDAFKTALPASDMRAMERRCVALEQENAELKLEVVEADDRVADVQEVLSDLKKAHDYMLHTYFREVLMLRCRIDDLQRQSRARRAYSVTATPLLSGGAGGGSASYFPTMESQLQQFRFKTSVAAGQVDAGGAPSAAASARNTPPPPPPQVAPAEEESDADGDLTRRRLSSTHISPREMVSDADVPAQSTTTVFTTAGDAAAAADIAPAEADETTRAPSPIRKDRNVRIRSPGAGLSRSPVVPKAPRSMTVQTTTTVEVMNVAEPDSVDAIFDYEEYVRILNGEGGAWVRRFADAMGDPVQSGAGSSRRRSRSVRLRTRARSEVYLVDGGDSNSPASHTEDSAAAEALEQEHARASGFRWLLHLALEPIQHKFHVQLEQLRQAVRAMQREHVSQIHAIERALLNVQSRNDALLDFLNTFVLETQHTLSVLARDAQAQNMMELLSSGALPVAAAEEVTSFFSAAASTASPRGRLSPATPTASPLFASDGAADFATAQEASTPHTLRKKEWRLKPGAVIEAQEQAASMSAMEQRLGKANPAKAMRSMPRAPVTAAEAAHYYRADLGLPYWTSHPVTAKAQRTFGELQQVAATIRATRVKQLFAAEEGVGGGGGGERRVRWESQRSVASSGSRHEDSDHHGRTSPPPLWKDGSNTSFYYFRDGSIGSTGGAASGVGVGVGATGAEGASGSAVPRHRLREGWRTATVSGADGRIAGDLLRELTGLRMRRACDQKRLKRVVASMPQQYRKDVAAAIAEKAEGGKGKGKKKKKGEAACDAGDAAAEAPQLYFTTVEEVLRARAMRELRARTQQRLGQTSLRIAELQRLLQLHFEEFELDSSEDSVVGETTRRVAAEEARGLYRISGILKPTGQLWSSPYLNDAALDASGAQQQQQQQQRRARNGGGASRPVGYVRGDVTYLPIGMTGAHDADGNPVGGAGACVVLDGSTLSAAPFAKSASAGSGGAEGGERAATSDSVTPYMAVMDYCRGVQMGRPLGRRGGPVYLFQDVDSGHYFVGDQDGRDVLAADEADVVADGPASAARAGPDARRTLLPMTRILFPAPAESSSSTASSAAPTCDPSLAASMALADVATAPLQPVYLVPMAIPLSHEAAAVREGWQACHRHGHTRSDPIYYTTMAPLPLSTSYHHVVPQAAEVDVLSAVGAETMAVGNRYLRSPPRVFQPVSDAAAMVRIRALSLQQRQATIVDGAQESGGGGGPPSEGTCEPGDGLLCASSTSTSPGVTASPAATAAAAVPSSAGVLSGYTLSAAEAPPLSVGPPLDVVAWHDGGRGAAGAGAAAALPIHPPPSSVASSALAASVHDGAASLAKAALASSAVGGGVAALTAAAGAGAGAGAGAAGAAAAAAAPMPPVTTSVPAAPLTAALVVAKELRNARLAEEAARAAHARTQRQDSLRSRTLAHTVPSHIKDNDVVRGPPHRLAPLGAGTSHHGSEALSMLPLPTNSTRLQQQLRPERYALAPPPPSSRWRELNGGAAGAWDLSTGTGTGGGGGGGSGGTA